MTVLEQLKSLFRSRKFWALLAGLATIASAFGTNQIDAWQAVQAVIAATSAYALSTAIEDNGN